MTNSRLDFLFQRFLRREATAAEKEELMDLVADDHNEQQVNALLEDSWNTHDFSGSPLTSEETEQLLKDINAAKEQPIRIAAIKNWYRYTVAASIIIFLTAGGYFLIHKKNEDRASKQPIAKVEKGLNKAILTLANGKKIDLSDAKSGNLVKEAGLKIYKDKQGRLTYVAQGAADHDASQPVSYNTTETPRGGQWHLILADGTNVWLNAASSIHYPTRFTGGERDVELTGEAYFEVAKNAAMPFVVKKKESDVEVQVLGTHFNFNAYDDEGKTKVTLVEGSVKVQSAIGNRESAILKPGEQAIVSNQANGSFTIDVDKEADVEEALAWKNGMFRFNNTNIAAIMKQVTRWYDVDILYEGDVMNEFFSGTIPRNTKASGLFSVLELTQTVQFTINNKKVIVKPYKKA